MNKNKQDNSTLNKILCISSVVLSIACCITLVVFINDYRFHVRNDDIGEGYFYYSLEDQDYSEMYRYSLVNEALNSKTSEDKEKLYAIGDYCHSKLFYYAFKDSDAERADALLARMKEDAEKTGDLGYAIEKIDELFYSYE